MIEHFKPAGHKAPNLTTAIALEETFKPIQRVLHNDELLGYLFREVEYRKGRTEDVVLANSIFQQDNIRHNPFGFSSPSGPLMMELTYRAMHDKSKLHDDLKERIGRIYRLWPRCNTKIDYDTNTIYHQHLDGNPERQQIIKLERPQTILSDDMNATTQLFLAALLGPRAPQAYTIFSAYGTPVRLWTSTKQGPTNQKLLVLGITTNGMVSIDADDDILNERSARGVAPAKRILNMKNIKVAQ